jgi:protein-tyrosine-phosphatase
MRQILFVCTGNTCRSVIAEYLARRRLDSNSVSCESAGLRLVRSEDSRNAIQTLASNFEVDASGHVPREIGQVELSRFDIIVAIDTPGSNHVFRFLREKCISDQLLVQWRINDPYGSDPSEYDRCALETVRSLQNLKAFIASH